MTRRADTMRDNPTRLELLVESFLDDLNLEHRKQVVIDHYIVDFLLSRRRVIEADGPSHDNLEQRHYDQVRRNYLNWKGYRVLNLHWSLPAVEAKRRINQFVMGHNGSNGKPALDDDKGKPGSGLDNQVADTHHVIR